LVETFDAQAKGDNVYSLIPLDGKMPLLCNGKSELVYREGVERPSQE